MSNNRQEYGKMYKKEDATMHYEEPSYTEEERPVEYVADSPRVDAQPAKKESGDIMHKFLTFLGKNAEDGDFILVFDAKKKIRKVQIDLKNNTIKEVAKI